ncbi:hypothetical protein NPX13_g3491 [Xylaria arbuscula]|uniref:Ankyrin n=1 Tax=Xylaria arbuscula TaxID=114810 RepID=A0A9W8TPH6_9PEZI|nr:hypothetical protein NPX13_g3491 [Xylaria arbuscula]
MSLDTVSGMEAAIAAGDLQTVKNLYTTINEDQKSALLTSIASRAAGKAKTEILDWCFRSGLEVPSTSVNNELYDQACLSLSLAVFGVLVSHGADLNRYHSEYVGDALSLAAYHGDIELARFLLQNGVDPNQAWGYQEHEPGVWAVVGPTPSPEILGLMLQHGWLQKDSTAHIAAAELGNLETLKLLVEADHSADLEYAGAWWPIPSEGIVGEVGTALYRAALTGKEEVVAYLLEKGANPKFEDSKGQSCLRAAKQGGNEKVIHMLQGSN